MVAIKAIETKYKGYRMRSRLEARWALFFDICHEKWEYEREGYQLKSGRYLPDFWLPRLDMWVEVKGESPTKQEVKLLEELCHATDKMGMFLIGTPGNNRPMVYVTCTDSSGGGQYWDDDEYELAFREDGTGRVVLTLRCTCSKRDCWYSPNWVSGLSSVANSSVETTPLTGLYEMARSARFDGRDN